MALLSFEFDFFVKSCRHFIGILAWTWAIFVFCLSYIGRSNSYNNNEHYFLNSNNNRHGAPSLYRTVFLPILKVLLVAPSASLAGPVPNPAPSPTVASDVASQSVQPTAATNTVAVPWGQGIIVAGRGAQIPQQGPVGGFIYCAGCSPINPGQLYIPANVPLAQTLSASGVIPPQYAKAVQDGASDFQQLNGEEPGKGQKIWDDSSVPVQQMALHDDGRYSFSYNTALSSRQEERNLDGSVSGSYSYTDPDGKLVQVDYTASKAGYQAVGENVPPQPILPLPQPVKDTLEVQRARQEHLDAYNRELERIQRDHEAAAAAAATASTPRPEDVQATSSTTPSSSEVTGEEAGTGSSVTNDQDDSETDNSNDDAVIVSGKTEPGNEDGKPLPLPSVQQIGGDVHDEQTDSIVINAKGNSEEVGQNLNESPVRSSLPSPSYQITIPFGVGENAGVSVQHTGARGQEEGQQQQQQQGHNVAQNNAGQANLQPYFYYVSVGGQPHYVTSNTQPGYNSPYPTSLKASLLGALPLAAVHDAQVPNRATGASGENNSPNALRPVFLDLENGLKLEQQQQPQQSSMPQQQQQQQQIQTLINPASLFTLQNQNVNPLLGQLIPLGLTQGNGATFGYIPAVILNNNGNGNAGQIFQQTSQGSQSQANVPLQQQQQVSSTVPTSLNNQPIIVLASKK